MKSAKHWCVSVKIVNNILYNIYILFYFTKKCIGENNLKYFFKVCSPVKIKTFQFCLKIVLCPVFVVNGKHLLPAFFVKKDFGLYFSHVLFKRTKTCQKVLIILKRLSNFPILLHHLIVQYAADKYLLPVTNKDTRATEKTLQP